MNLRIGILALAVLAVPARAQSPDWLFPLPDPTVSRSVQETLIAADDAERAKVEGDFTGPSVPQIVKARKSDEVARCMGCHLPSGFGQPQTATLAGLPPGYFIQQMADFSSGARRGYRAQNMSLYARGLTEAEVREVAAYYATLRFAPWIKVRESDTAPRTYVGPREIRAPLPSGGRERLGNRIIELSDSPEGPYRPSEPAYTAYVPNGSVARGEALVTLGGGRTAACRNCHGETLLGNGDIPALAGRSPVYIARQLHQYRSGARGGSRAAIMVGVVANLQDDDIVAIAAYLASRPPL